ncbi:LysR substrate-binding domain-containing protein [Ensifer sp. 4252]|uniref:LysR substrate-binding domain-containing protein n=1 Tax=Ensifer sp. 4252 TaxID=3373915 RepID=UPI003D1F673A
MQTDDLNLKSQRPLPPLNALRAFDALARCGSLRAAAIELGVVPGAVRQQLASLEEHFGFALLDRQGGRVTLTPAGRRLADAVGVAFAIVSRAAEEISSSGSTVRLRLGVPMPMASAWMMPRLVALQNAVSGLEVDIVPVAVNQSLTDMPEIDALIVGGEYRPLPDITATAFMDDRFGPVLAAGQPAPIDLTDMTALVARTVPYLWDDWFRESGNPPVRFRKRIEVDDLTLALSAARSGLGVTIAPATSIEADLASATLHAPFGFVSRPTGYRLCCRIADRDRKPIAALRTWLLAEGRSLEGKLPSAAV